MRKRESAKVNMYKMQAHISVSHPCNHTSFVKLYTTGHFTQTTDIVIT